ncbi:hypothetical protein HK100_005493 [Physocladia obscura]|uniref:Uncharacterized protein n=1 Tax=Physocladia obscura TaxID=109957 RepID=A0AAD5T5S0_9FUNG|nr:hypothetical protein HK100_005493 [Physocladia obscura]
MSNDTAISVGAGTVVERRAAETRQSAVVFIGKAIALTIIAIGALVGLIFLAFHIAQSADNSNSNTNLNTSITTKSESTALNSSKSLWITHASTSVVTS